MGGYMLSKCLIFTVLLLINRDVFSQESQQIKIISTIEYTEIVRTNQIRYKGNEFTIKGIVCVGASKPGDFEKSEFYYKVVLTKRTSNSHDLHNSQLYGLFCYFKKSDLSQIINLEPLDEIIIKGKCKNVDELYDCMIVNIISSHDASKNVFSADDYYWYVNDTELKSRGKIFTVRGTVNTIKESHDGQEIDVQVSTPSNSYYINFKFKYDNKSKLIELNRGDIITAKGTFNGGWDYDLRDCTILKIEKINK
jgi:hypothetical protein